MQHAATASQPKQAAATAKAIIGMGSSHYWPITVTASAKSNAEPTCTDSWSGRSSVVAMVGMLQVRLVAKVGIPAMFIRLKPLISSFMS